MNIMKNLVLSMLAIASISVLSSCSSESDVIDEVTGGDQVEIKLNAGVIGVETKAPITGADTFTPSIVGWNEKDQPSVAATAPAWTTTPTAAIAGNASSTPIALTDKQYYDAGNVKHTYIRGYFPVGTASNGAVSFTNTTGDQDVMMTPIVDAGTRTTATAAELTFSHKLSQLNFKVKKDASLQGAVTLTSITIKNAELPTGFDITTGTITYATATDLPIPGISAPTIRDTEAGAGSPVMIKPLESTELSLDIVTSQGTFNNIKATVTAIDANGGTSYTITLTFKQKDITTTAAVTDWTTATGAGDVI